MRFEMYLFWKSRNTQTNKTKIKNCKRKAAYKKVNVHLQLNDKKTKRLNMNMKYNCFLQLHIKSLSVVTNPEIP